MKGLKNTVDYFMLFLKTCLLVTLDRMGLYQKEKPTGKMFLLLTGESRNFVLLKSRKQIKKKRESPV